MHPKYRKSSLAASQAVLAVVGLGGAAWPCYWIRSSVEQTNPQFSNDWSRSFMNFLNSGSSSMRNACEYAATCSGVLDLQSSCHISLSTSYRAPSSWDEIDFGARENHFHTAIH